MKYIRLGLYILAAVLVVPLGAHFFADSHGHTTHFAVWHNNPETMEQAKSLATDIVLAQVVSVDKGQDIVQDVEGEPAPVVIPTELITVRVLQSVKGMAPGSEVKVFRTGGSNITLEGDPAYRVGEQHVLFLQPQDGTSNYLVISPEGRYAVRGGKVEPASKREFTAGVRGKDLEAFLSSLR